MNMNLPFTAVQLSRCDGLDFSNDQCITKRGKP